MSRSYNVMYEGVEHPVWKKVFMTLIFKDETVEVMIHICERIGR